MNFHFDIDPKYVGRHSLLAPSSHFLDKDRTPEELDALVYSRNAAEIGTCIHSLCANIIRKHKRPSSKAALYDLMSYWMSIWGTMVEDQKIGGKAATPIPTNLIDPNRYLDTVWLYIKDALTFDMTPEVPLFLSPFAGGTTDAICFNERKRYLRIHDLKTGSTPAKIDQLEEYAAYFFLYYKKKPGDCSGIELRIYQNGEALIEHATAEDILPIMDRIETAQQYLATNYGE